MVAYLKCSHSCRRSPQRCSIKKPVLKNFTILTGKHLCWSLFWLKLRQETPTQVFSCEYCENFKNTYFGKHLRTAVSGLKKVKAEEDCSKKVDQKKEVLARHPRG